MDWKIFGLAFGTLFMAELGDKTQLAIITMSASSESKISVFLGAGLALLLVSFLGVVFGTVITKFIPGDWLQRVVAVLFILIGIYLLLPEKLFAR
jgi:putative Ca2+/H+ antiporter (TMEM165/GDT1 family)